jgi:hypothetical protein
VHGPNCTCPNRLIAILIRVARAECLTIPRPNVRASNVTREGRHLPICRSPNHTLPSGYSHAQHMADCSLKQRFGPVAPAMKFVHWVCEEMDQRFAGYSV